MNYLIIDTETTCLKIHPTKPNGNPFSKKNFLVYVGILSIKSHSKQYYDFPIEYNEEPYGENLRQIQKLIDEHDILVFFNAKFDLHWLDRYGISFNQKRCYDIQLVEFILKNQKIKFPNLNDVAISYGFEGKLDIVKKEYWDNGIDTEQIPREILIKYLYQDVLQSSEVFFMQQKYINSKNKILISLANQDLITLLEIEKNGMLYDINLSITEGNKIQEEINEIDKQLKDITAFPSFNGNSGDHISVVLFGGSITIPYQEIIGVYKTGPRAGQEKLGLKEKEIYFPRLVDPLPGTELKKEGYFETNIEALRSVNASGTAAKIIKLLLNRSKLDKLVNTYLHGIPKLIEEQDRKSTRLNSSH